MQPLQKPSDLLCRALRGRRKRLKRERKILRCYGISEELFNKLLFAIQRVFSFVFLHFFPPIFSTSVNPTLLFARGELLTGMCYLPKNKVPPTTSSPAPHLRMQPIMFAGTQNQAGSAATAKKAPS